MKRKEIEEKLERFARMFGCLVCCNAEYFCCWYQSDYDDYEMDDNMYFVLSRNDDEESKLGDVSLMFSVHKKSFALKLFAEHYANDDFIIYQHENLQTMTETDVHQMVKKFEEIMKPWFDAINEIKKLDDAKKLYYNIMNDIFKNVFHWE